eukprot:CAMPEP_0117426054 /NCGR_PEP_ID=MMETSP0758-20121206/6231_1 /TAXON_ID=63605 /ORGANISM="Percolomonas cosmopolitus, Strain AE-1 (ATCC 50343)" /LENGTH=123 /DNA_ID=CAMNT_0005210965 /DNA_START=657 /DNA_END=1025 /DNA_ORIENTATION=-
MGYNTTGRLRANDRDLAQVPKLEENDVLTLFWDCYNFRLVYWLNNESGNGARHVISNWEFFEMDNRLDLHLGCTIFSTQIHSSLEIQSFVSVSPFELLNLMHESYIEVKNRIKLYKRVKQLKK